MILIIIGNLLGAWKLCLLKAERTLQCKVIVLERLSRQGHTVYYALVTTRTLGPGDKPHLLHSTLLLIQQFMFFVCWFVKVAIFRTSSRVQGRSLVGGQLLCRNDHRSSTERAVTIGRKQWQTISIGKNQLDRMSQKYKRKLCIEHANYNSYDDTCTKVYKIRFSH